MITSEMLAGDERTDLLAALGKQRDFLRCTVRELTDEQAALTPTVSALCLGGLVKHVTYCERGWTDFVLDGAEALAGGWDQHADSFRMLPGETLADLLAVATRPRLRTRIPAPDGSPPRPPNRPLP